MSTTPPALDMAAILRDTSNRVVVCCGAGGVGKTTTAALFGVAVEEGLIDIDKPLQDYGVKPTTHWEDGHSWGSFFPKVTAKSLLAQAGGYGVVEPGSEFTYDSQEYIQHLSYALTAVSANKSALQYAREKFAVPMGMPQREPEAAAADTDDLEARLANLRNG